MMQCHYPHYRTATVTTLLYMAIMMESSMLHQEYIMTSLSTFLHHYVLLATLLLHPVQFLMYHTEVIVML